MIDLKSKIDESLFGGKDDEVIVKNAEKQAKLDRLRKLCVGSRESKALFDAGEKAIRVTDSGIEIDTTWRGDDLDGLYITTQDTKFKDVGISKFFGQLTIIGCNKIKDLTGLFTPDAEFSGSLCISQCGNITSLKGLPKNIDANTKYEIWYNRNLDDMEGLPKNVWSVVWKNNKNCISIGSSNIKYRANLDYDMKQCERLRKHLKDWQYIQVNSVED